MPISNTLPHLCVGTVLLMAFLGGAGCTTGKSPGPAAESGACLRADCVSGCVTAGRSGGTCASGTCVCNGPGVAAAPGAAAPATPASDSAPVTATPEPAPPSNPVPRPALPRPDLTADGKTVGDLEPECRRFCVDLGGINAYRGTDACVLAQCRRDFFCQRFAQTSAPCRSERLQAEVSCRGQPAGAGGPADQTIKAMLGR